VAELDWLGLPATLDRIFIPVGYIEGPRDGTMSPLYPVGFPLHLRAAAALLGWEYGLALVSPLAAVISVVLMFKLAKELGLSSVYATAASIILGLNPTFLFQAFQPMSDVVATCWSLTALLAALRARKREVWAVVVGAAVGIDVLVRPVDGLVLIPVLFALPLNRRVLMFLALGALPSVVGLFAYNLASYGNPLSTGYGLSGLYGLIRVSHFAARFEHYAYWLSATMSPVLLIGWLSLAFDRKAALRDRLILLSWFGAFLLFYSCYYYYVAWWYTRFLLPAIPALILASLIVARDLNEYARRHKRARLLLVHGAACVALVVVLTFEVGSVIRFDLFSFGRSTLMHRESCRWADTILPPKSLIVSMEMSGALKFYTQRGIVRYDGLELAHANLIKSRASERGYHLYALLLAEEVEEARKRFAGKWTRLGAMSSISLWLIEPDGV